MHQGLLVAPVSGAMQAAQTGAIRRLLGKVLISKSHTRILLIEHNIYMTEIVP